MEFDYSKLSGRVREVCGTQEKFAEMMGKSVTTISAKMNNASGWSRSDMLLASDVLKFPKAEIPDYFFTIKVQY